MDPGSLGSNLHSDTYWSCDRYPALRLGLAITGESAGGERSSGEQRDELLWKEERQVRAQM